MRSKRFRFRKSTLFTRLYGGISLVLLVVGLIVFFATGEAIPLQVMGVVAPLSLIVGSRMDNNKNGYFYIDQDELVLKNLEIRRRIQLIHISDASIVDPGAAKRYIQGRIADADNVLSAKKRTDIYTQFSTTELGINSKWMTLLLLFNAPLSAKRKDLILLRLVDDTDVLLSPIHEQDAISYLNKAFLAAKQKSEQHNLFNNP